MKPIKIIAWACPICNTEYEAKEEAIKCLSQPEVTPNYEEGDIVYLVERYPDDEKKPFVKRRITKVQGVILDDREHKIGYELNEAVQTGKTCYVGEEGSWDDSLLGCSLTYHLAYEDDFLRLGDPRYWDESIVVSPETVENWEEIL